MEALVNTVNCVGVMGRGIALQFKRMLPENFRAYAEACRREEVRPGRMFVYESDKMINPRYIINFPTKRHWRGKSRMEHIDAGLVALVQEIADRNIHSIAIPPLGSSLGGLNWTEVRPRIESALGGIDGLTVLLLEPGGGPADGRHNRSAYVPRMTGGRSALIGLMDRYLRGLLDPFVSLLEIHKLMYFMERAGEPLRLGFTQGYYGPYSGRLRHVLNSLEGHHISGYEDGGDTPSKQIMLVPGAVAESAAFLESHPQTRDRLERVSDLVDGFDSPFGLELLSTVHWVATQHPTSSNDEIVEHTHAWSPHNKQFSERHIHEALGLLKSKGWLQATSQENA